MPTATNTEPATAGERGPLMVSIVKQFRSFDGSTISVLSDGRAVRDGITGLMLLDEVGGRFVRYLDSLAEVTA